MHILHWLLTHEYGAVGLTRSEEQVAENQNPQIDN
jgi:hypothetical protein